MREKGDLLKKDFQKSLGKIAYQISCHQRVQNIGPVTKNILEMIPDTEVETIERCSGHDGTYALKKETYNNSKKIVNRVVKKVDSTQADYLTSDCPLAGEHIKNFSAIKLDNVHPISLLRKAYNL